MQRSTMKIYPILSVSWQYGVMPITPTATARSDDKELLEYLKDLIKKMKSHSRDRFEKAKRCLFNSTESGRALPKLYKKQNRRLIGNMRFRKCIGNGQGLLGERK